MPKEFSIVAVVVLMVIAALIWYGLSGDLEWLSTANGGYQEFSEKNIMSLDVSDLILLIFINAVIRNLLTPTHHSTLIKE